MNRAIEMVKIDKPRHTYLYKEKGNPYCPNKNQSERLCL